MSRASRQIPQDFHLFAAQPYRVLEERFHVTRTTIKRWRKEIGVEIRPGAPVGNRNADKNASRRKSTHGIDGPEQIQKCLSCPFPSCRGNCARIYPK